MAGFLSGLARLAVPLGEVGGAALTQQGVLSDAIKQRQQRQAALSGLVSDLGPDYSKVGPAIASGVDPNTALSLVQSAKTQRDRQSILSAVAANKGVWTPDLAVRAVGAGLIPASTINKILGKTTQAPDGPAAVQILQSLIDKESDPAKKAQLQAMIPAAMENGTIIFSRTGKLNAFANPSEKPPPISWRTTRDAEGNEIQVPYRYDAASRSEVPVGIADGGVPGKLNQNQQKQLDSINAVQRELPNLRTLVQQLPDATPGALAEQYAKYRAPFGAAGAVDPRYGAYFNALGQIQTDLIQSAMGSSRAYQLVQDLKPHIPTPLDPPSRALEKLNGFDAGRFAAVKRTILGGGNLPASSPSAPPPAPPFAYSEVRVAPDGSYLAKSNDGTIYHYDTVKGVWLPATR